MFFLILPLASEILFTVWEIVMEMYPGNYFPVTDVNNVIMKI